MKNNSLFDSFNNALNGVIYTLKHERNFKIHFLMAFLVLLLSMYINLDLKEVLIVFLCITLVLVAELFNTAIEAIVDLVCKEKNELAKIAKDTAAGGVFIAAFSSTIIGYLIIVKKLMQTDFTNRTILIIKQTPIYSTFICVIIVLMMTIVLKSLTNSPNLLRGGMPSAHAAIGFSLATCILFITEDTLAICIAFVLALLVAQSRVEGKIHSIIQVFLGSLLGTLITIMIFSLIHFNV